MTTTTKPAPTCAWIIEHEEGTDVVVCDTCDRCGRYAMNGGCFLPGVKRTSAVVSKHTKGKPRGEGPCPDVALSDHEGQALCDACLAEPTGLAPIPLTDALEPSMAPVTVKARKPGPALVFPGAEARRIQTLRRGKWIAFPEPFDRLGVIAITDTAYTFLDLAGEGGIGTMGTVGPMFESADAIVEALPAFAEANGYLAPEVLRVVERTLNIGPVPGDEPARAPRSLPAPRRTA